MKRTYCIGLSVLLACWAIGFFVFHAPAPIHTLAGLAILMLLHAMIKGEILCPPAERESTELPCEKSIS
jgi:hypothetical protein